MTVGHKIGLAKRIDLLFLPVAVLHLEAKGLIVV